MFAAKFGRCYMGANTGGATKLGAKRFRTDVATGIPNFRIAPWRAFRFEGYVKSTRTAVRPVSKQSVSKLCNFCASWSRRFERSAKPS
jgi:hypothetical protein